MQNRLGKGLSALGQGLNSILNNVNKIPEDIRDDILKNLGDSGRILANLFHRISLTRKNLIVPCLKNMKNLADNCTPSEYLFGTDLSEKLNSAKHLETITKELKLPNKSKNTPFIKKTTYGGGGSQVRFSGQGSSGMNRNLNHYRPARRTGETGQNRAQTSRSSNQRDHQKEPQWGKHRRRKY